MLTDTLTQAWQPWTDAELSERNKLTPKKWLQVPIQNGYQHQPWESGDSRHFTSDTHPEDTWN
ncbi:hypothetical protein [Acaryochloris marina]|uniref:Uncharacterized protein n=1 Tax=Acaryochloris marina (strain MBIC 11017) TaxID=329726 RepID=A8ZNL5_ACAM1|nr:hypothetical protein [Acaryochloris marina]ABW32601.1 hypothetical protein AM1_D0106 [Acaryochloris marina MBIC11017]